MNDTIILPQDKDNFDDPRNLPIWEKMEKEEQEFLLKRAGLIQKPGPPRKQKRPAKTDIPVQLFIARTKAGFTQAQLAKAAGLTQSAYARIEAGSANPTLRTVLKLCEALGHDLRMQSRG